MSPIYYEWSNVYIRIKKYLWNKTKFYVKHTKKSSSVEKTLLWMTSGHCMNPSSIFSLAYTFEWPTLRWLFCNCSLICERSPGFQRHFPRTHISPHQPAIWGHKMNWLAWWLVISMLIISNSHILFILSQTCFSPSAEIVYTSRFIFYCKHASQTADVLTGCCEEASVHHSG